MDSPLSLQHEGFIDASKSSSLDRLLESGFLCVRQGHCAEGLAFFALAREKLSPDRAQLAAALDALAQSHTSYLRTQEELMHASRRFARADTEQQAQIAALELLLSTLQEETKRVPAHDDGPQQHTRGQSLLRILQPLSSDLPGDLPTDQPIGQLPLGSADDQRDNQPLSLSPADLPLLPDLHVTCFGHFEVKRQESPVVLCSNRHGQAIMRYLVAQPEHCATSDTLMTLLWPDEELEVAQPRLHTSICTLRHSLNAGYTCESGGGYIVCKNRTYCLNPAISVQTDVDQFLHYYRAGRQAHEERIGLYEKACHLYTGPFLTEDKYADWSSPQREYLCRLYIEMCRMLSEHYLKVKKYEEAEEWANAVLKENRCDEPAHRQLMQIYAPQGRRSEVFQQYQRCERILRDEMAVSPMPETMHLMQMLLKSDPSSASEAKI